MNSAILNCVRESFISIQQIKMCTNLDDSRASECLNAQETNLSLTGGEDGIYSVFNCNLNVICIFSRRDIHQFVRCINLRRMFPIGWAVDLNLFIRLNVCFQLYSIHYYNYNYYFYIEPIYRYANLQTILRQIKKEI